MNNIKNIALFLPMAALINCSSSSEESVSLGNSLVSFSDDAAEVCSAAGMAHLPRAEKYEVEFRRSSGWTYIAASGVFQYEAPFAYTPPKVVDARAPYGDLLIAEKGKILHLLYASGIADLRHTTENFQFFLGYKVAGVDRWAEMKLSDNSNASYSAYELDFDVPQEMSTESEIWFEAHYKKDGLSQRAFDSNEGRNFKVKFVDDARKSLCFDSGWRESLNGGELEAGDSFEIVYDVKRLLASMMGTTYAAWPAWYAYMNYSVVGSDGVEIEGGKLPLFANAYDPENGSPSTRRPSYKPLLLIPNAAAGGRLVFWFHGPNRGPTVWDSDFGHNYIVEIK